MSVARNESPSQAASARSAAAAIDRRTLKTPHGVVDLFSHDPGFVVAATDRYMIQITRTRGHQPGVRAMGHALEELATRHDKFGCIAVVESGAKLRLPADIREGYGALVKRYSPYFSGIAVIYEKSGFQATALRSLMTALNVASRATHPHHVFADVREGAAWVSKLTAHEPTPATLVHIVKLLQTTLDNGG
jgi:hypothetical protein